MKCMLKVSDTSQQSFKIIGVWLSSTRNMLTPRQNDSIQHYPIVSSSYVIFWVHFSLVFACYCLVWFVFNFCHVMPLSSLCFDVPKKSYRIREAKSTCTLTLKRARNVSVSQCENSNSNYNNNHLRIYDKIDVCRS